MRLFSITFYLINPSNEFFIIGFIFFNLIHIIFRQNNWLWNSFSISFFIFYFLSFKSLFFNSTIFFLTLKDYIWPLKIGYFACFTMYFVSIFLFLYSNCFETFWKQKILYFRNFYSNFELFVTRIFRYYIHEYFSKIFWEQYCF